MTADGKYIFTNGGIEQMFRLRLDGDRVQFEEASPRLGAGMIQLSPDAQFVCLPSGGGNGAAGAPSYSTIIFLTTSFKKRECILNSGAYPRAVGFDPKGGYIFAQNHGNELVLYTSGGVKRKEYHFGPPNTSSDVRQFLAHPSGNKLLLLTGTALYLIEVPPRNTNG
jgi:hypothetical protein